MDKYIIMYLKEKKFYEYLKDNSFYIKKINRSNDIKEFLEFIKDKYHLRVSDKVNNVIDGIDMLNTVLSNIN